MEIIVVTAIFALVAASVIPAWVGSVKTGKQGVEYAVAAGYLEEGVQAVRSIRDRDWSELSSGTHGLSTASGMYALSGVSESLDGGTYTRTITVEDTYRQGGLTGDLDPTGDTPDPNTKHITVNVQWSVADGNPQNLDMVVYLSNWQEPLWAQTTIVDFTAGNENSTDVQAVGNGAIGLRASVAAWNSLETLYTIDLSGTGERIAMQFDRDRDVLYVLSTNTDGNEFVVLDASAVSEASPTVVGGLEAPGMNGFIVHNGYLYLAGTSNTAEISVYNARTLAFVRSINMSGNADALGVGAFGNTLAVARDQEDDAVSFYDVSNPAAGVPLLGNTDISEHVEKVVVTQTHAYVGGRDNEEEIFVIRLSDLAEVASLDLDGNNDVQMLLVSGTSLYVSRTNGTSWDFVELDITDPASPTQVGTHELGVDAGGFAVSPSGNHAFVSTSADDKELVAIALDTFGQVAQADVAGNEDGRSAEAYGAHAYLGSTSNTQDIAVFRTAQGDWDAPQLITSIDKEGSHDMLETLVQGNFLYAGTRNGLSEGEFFIYDITNPALPLLLSSFDAGARVRDQRVAGNYAYLATDDDNRELQILDISVKTSPVRVGSFNAPGNADGKSLFVSGNTVYLGRKDSAETFFVIDVSDPAFPVELGRLPFTSSINEVVPDGSYVYASTDADNAEVLVIDISNPLAPVQAAAYDLPGDTNVDCGALTGDVLLVGRQVNGGSELVLLNVSNPLSPTILGEGEVGGNVENIALDGSNVAYLASSESDHEFQRWDISVPSLPREQSTFDLGAIALGVAFDGVYAYLGTEHDTLDIQILGPSAAVVGFAREGSFTSQAFDSGSAGTVWDRIEWTSSGTGTLQFRIRTADTRVNLDAARWVEADGTVGSSYTVSGSQIVPDPSATGSRFIQWKAYLTGDGTMSPLLEDVTLYY